MKEKSSYKELLDQKQFLKMIGANLINRFGDSLDLIAFQWIVFEITGSASWIAVIMGVNFLPNVLFRPFSGVFVDRLNKKRTMIISDAGRAILTIFCALGYVMGFLTPWLMLIITFLNSTLESFRLPGAVGLRAKILDKDKFTLGIGLDMSLSRITEIAGLALAGVIIAISPATALFIDAATFFISMLIIGSIKCREEKSEWFSSLSSYTGELKSGISYLINNKVLLYLILFGTAVNFPESAWTSFKTPYIADTLGMGPEFLSFVSIAMTIGMALGTFITPKFFSPGRGRGILVGIGFINAFVYLILAFIPSWFSEALPITLTVSLTLFVYGITFGVVSVVFSSSIYRLMDDDYVGRVSGILGSLTVLTVPISSFIFAGLATVFTIPQMFMLAAVLYVIAHGWVIFPKEFKEL